MNSFAPNAAAPNDSAPNAAAPNAAAPNAAAPNDSAPNASAPNASAPNVSAPNAAAPNGTPRLARPSKTRSAMPALAWALCASVFVATGALAQEEGPIEGPLEGPIEGPIEGPLEGPIEGPLEGPIEGPLEGQGGAEAGPTTLAAGDTGLRGVVTDGESDDAPMAAVMIEVVEAARTTMSDGQGRYAIALPPGAYTLRIFTDFYLPVRLEGVDVREGEITEIPPTSLELDEGAMMDAVVVTGRADTNSAATQLQVRRQAAGVQDAVSADEISRSGDSSAGSAARRVVATTIVGGQYLYVRGLGGRYTNVLLNGATLPQLDTNLSGVQLDLFPSFALASISIRKSYTPDLPGAFGGGTALLTTREFPEEFEVNASIGLSYNSETTFRRGQVHRGGRFDLIGFDDGTRALPSEVSNVALRRDAIPDTDERRAAERSFDDRLEVQEQRVGLGPIDQLSLRIGNRFDLGSNVDLGVAFAAGWSLDRQRLRERLRSGTFVDDQVEERDNLERESFELTGRLAAMGTASLLFGDDHELNFTSLFNQIGEDYTGSANGFLNELDGQSFRQRQSFIERQLWFNQLRGRHYMNNARITWQAYTTGYSRDQPDTRDFRYAPDEDPETPWPEGPYPEGVSYNWVDRQPVSGQRLFIGTTGRDFGASATLDYDVRQLGRYKFQLGLAAHRTEQDLRIRRFDYGRTSRPSDTQLFRQPPELLFANENAGDLWVIREITTPDDSYEAQENLFGAFASMQLEVTEWLRLFAGARVE
ncbi:MAG: carboxypeptidase regulatory-like domain-containing protein, partial [Myxococcota bacterium]